MLAGKAGNKAKCRIIYAQAIQHNGDIDALAADADGFFSNAVKSAKCEIIDANRIVLRIE